MALTKITLTGTVDTIKAAFTKVNDIIDDLVSTSNGLGASTIGVEDSAGNMAATNVETALAEIYTDTADAITLGASFDEDSSTTTGLTWGFKTGMFRHFDGTVSSVSASTIGLTDDATNYVELDTSGTMTKNTSAFTPGYVPVREVVCASGSQTDSTDKRAWFQSTPVIDYAFARHFWKRPRFEYSSSTDIYIYPGSWRSEGATSRTCYTASKLTYTFTSLAVSDWSYLYIDDSDLETDGTDVITAARLIDSITEPAWSDAKEGWYNGNDRCIFAVYGSGADTMCEFFHDGGDYVLLADAISDYASSPDDVFANNDVTLTIPAFSMKAHCNFYQNATDTNVEVLSWRTNGQSGTTGHYVNTTDDDNAEYASNDVIVMTDSSGKIEIKFATASNHQVTVRTNGWYFPAYV